MTLNLWVVFLISLYYTSWHKHENLILNCVFIKHWNKRTSETAEYNNANLSLFFEGPPYLRIITYKLTEKKSIIEKVEGSKNLKIAGAACD